MPLSFDYQSSFELGQTSFQVSIPQVINPKQLDVVVTPFYVSINAPNYTTVIDLACEVRIDSPILKCKKHILTIQLENPDVVNEIYKTDDQGALLKRRNESFFTYQQHQKKLSEEQRDIEARQKHEAEMRQHEQKQQEIQQMRSQREEEIRIIKSQLDQPVNQEEVADAFKNLPGVRSTKTVRITADFTRRRMAVPARDGRDIYTDHSVGPIIPDVKKKSPAEQLEQARTFVRQRAADLESAVDILQNLLQQSPLYMEALVLLSQILLRQGRCDECLQFTAQMIKIVQNKHEIQLQQHMVQNFSLKLQAQVNALHAAALAGVGKYREAYRYLDSAKCMDRENSGLNADWELMQRIVKTLE